MEKKNKSDKTKKIFRPQELSCKKCGKKFIFSIDDQEMYFIRHWKSPKYCPECRQIFRKQKELKEQELVLKRKRKELRIMQSFY